MVTELLKYSRKFLNFSFIFFSYNDTLRLYIHTQDSLEPGFFQKCLKNHICRDYRVSMHLTVKP